MPIFALIGVGGYIAPRHMQAIKAIGSDLTVAFDRNDSVGIIDSYFPNASFFTEFERFDRHIDKLRRRGQDVDFISICSPNYLHDAHCRFALRSGANAICEKPLVLNPWNIDGLIEMERETGRSISTILQLRLHPIVVQLKKEIAASNKDEFAVDLTYITSRGRWYHASWKGDETKSGGIATNIGIHFFDMLCYLFGPIKRNVVHLRTSERAAGYLECGPAKVRWFLSIDARDLPPEAGGKTTFRSIMIDGKAIDFSGSFADLHIRSYEEIAAGRGFRPQDVRPSVEIVSDFRSKPIELNVGERHPAVSRHLA